MKIKFPCLLLAAVLLSAGCASSHNTLSISGAPGTMFTGTCTHHSFLGNSVTGVTQNLSGTVPKQFIIDCRYFDFTVRKAAPSDALNVTLNHGPHSGATAGTGNELHGVSGKVRWWGWSITAF